MIIQIDAAKTAEILAIQATKQELNLKELPSLEKAAEVFDVYSKWYDYYFEILTNSQID